MNQLKLFLPVIINYEKSPQKLDLFYQDRGDVME